MRLCLPADRLHRDLPVDRKESGGRPLGAPAAGRSRHVGIQARQARAQAGAVDRLCAVDRLHLRRLLHAHPRARCLVPGRLARTLADLLDLLLRLRHLRQRRFPARAGVQVHVPLCAFPERDVRQRHDDRDLRREAWRAAWAALEEGRPGGAGSGLLRGLHLVCAGLPHRHRHPQGPAVRVHRLRGLR
ncbi:hypothetical protein FQZ97_1056440 [compost metagenome]